MTWDDWAAHHALIFGMHDNDLEMLNEWATLIERMGFTPAHARDATDWVAMNQPPKYRSDHWNALCSRLQAIRATISASATNSAPQPPNDSCGACGGTGVVCGLPNPATWGRQGQTFCAALCSSCMLGRWIRQNCSDRMRGMQTMDEYERSNPDWREQLAQREVKQAADAHAMGLARDNDRLFGPLLNRIRRNLAAMERREEEELGRGN